MSISRIGILLLGLLLSSFVLAGGLSDSETSGEQRITGGKTLGSVLRSSDVTRVVGPRSSCRGHSVATCPSGTVAISGGHSFGGSCGCDEDYRFIINSYPNTERTWRARAECGYVYAYAMCIKVSD